MMPRNSCLPLHQNLITFALPSFFFFSSQRRTCPYFFLRLHLCLCFYIFLLNVWISHCLPSSMSTRNVTVYLIPTSLELRMGPVALPTLSNCVYIEAMREISSPHAPRNLLYFLFSTNHSFSILHTPTFYLGVIMLSLPPWLHLFRLQTCSHLS